MQDKIRQMAEDFEKHSAKTSEYLQSVIDENVELRNQNQKEKDAHFEMV